MRFPGFIGPAYTLRSVDVDCQRCVNLYPEMDEQKTGKEGEVFSLVGTPGLVLLATIGTGPLRCVYTATTGTLYVVSGNTLYSVSSTNASTVIGTLLTSTGQVSMVDDGFNLVIVDGPNGYDLNFFSTFFIQITDPGFLGATQVTFQDLYFQFNKPNSNEWYMADLPTGVATNAITFHTGYAASKEGFSDNIVGLISTKENVWLFGNRTTEVWYNSGATSFPFQTIQGAFIEMGLMSAFSIGKLNNTLFWLGQSNEGQGVVYMANGYTPVRVSTHAVEFAINQYTDLSSCTAYTYQMNGHAFYVLNFSKGTWVFDTTTNMWHERSYFNAGVFERHRANTHCMAYGKHILGDYANGNLYTFSDSVYTDNGNTIARLRTSPHLSKNLHRVYYSFFQLDIESGVGLDGIAQGTDPQAMLQWSNDGGHKWSNEYWESMGPIGKFNGEAKWNRLGQGRNRVFRVMITDPIKVVIIGAEIELEIGSS